MPKEILRVAVDRKKWLRGGQSVLRDEEGKMCCIGFAVLADFTGPKESLDLDAIVGEGEVSCLPNFIRGRLPHLVNAGHERDWLRRAYDINDINGCPTTIFGDEQREKQLTELGLLYGVEFSFVG